MTDTPEVDLVAFEGPETPDRGYTVRGSYLKPPHHLDALVELFKDGEITRQFRVPAYKLWNVAAHFEDIVTSELAGDTQGHDAAMWDGLSGTIVLSPQDTAPGA